MQNETFMQGLIRRITDRSFLLTLAVLIMSQLGGWTPQETLAGIATVAPFIFGEKFKDASVAKAMSAVPETISAAGDVTVQGGTIDDAHDSDAAG